MLPDEPHRRLTLPSDQNASGRSLGDEELTQLARVIRSGTLTATRGFAVAELEKRFASLLGGTHTIACASGSAAIHAAVAAVDPEPGEEIVTSPVTDMGALTPILYQAAIPVFADVDPRTGNLTAEAVRARLSERTRAIIVTHLFGNPADMTGILELARDRGIPVVEDCAQAFLARTRDHLVGTVGAIGCFSLQQGKHITTGEGGVVVTNDAVLAQRMRLFINKAWGYGTPNPDHEFLALNYRMSELAGAVGLAQLEKLERTVRLRCEMAQRLTRQLADVPGVEAPIVDARDRHTYWRYCLGIDDEVIPGGARALAETLAADGIASTPNYIKKPAFECRIFRERRTFGRSQFPFSVARRDALDYDPGRFPGTYAALRRMLVLPWNERYTAAHVDHIAAAIRGAAAAKRR